MKFVLCIAALLCAAAFETASATAPNTWILCDTCQTKPDFNSAALIWYGNRTYRTAVEVGNPITGVLYTVHIEYNSGGDPVGWEGDGTIAGNPPSVEIFQLPNGGRIVASSDESDEGINAFPPTGYPYVSSSFRDSANEQMFISYITLAKEGVFDAAGTDDFGLDSFAQQEMATVCRKLYGVASQENPSWSLAEAFHSLQQAVKGYVGRGPWATMVFRNGDVADYEIHTAGPHGCIYIKGSAKDVEGNDIPDEGWNPVSYGGGGPMNVNPGGVDLPGGVFYSNSYRSCAWIEGTLIGCLVF